MKAGVTSSYRFFHDRVQQAAYSFGSDAEKPALHLAIGRHWLQVLSPEKQQARLFDLVHHLNRGRSLITDTQERLRLAELDLAAIRQAKASFAYKPALNYAQAALEMVSEQDWAQRYDFMLALYLAAAEAAYLASDYVSMEHYLQVTVAHAANLLDEVKAQQIHIRAELAQGQFKEAVLRGWKCCAGWACRSLPSLANGTRYPD
jgi:predicted ATPase